MDMYEVSCLMLVLYSDCVGLPFRKLKINSLMSSAWNVGAFSMVTLRGWGGEPQALKAPQLGLPFTADAAIIFVAECMKPGEPKPSQISVNIHLHSGFGALRTQIEVICPARIFKEIDFSKIGYGLAERSKSEENSDRHVVYDEDQCDACEMTIVEDVSYCREIVSRICSGITSQLLSCGCWLRPVVDGELFVNGDEYR